MKLRDYSDKCVIFIWSFFNKKRWPLVKECPLAWSHPLTLNKLCLLPWPNHHMLEKFNMKGKGCLLTEFIRGSVCHEANAVALVQIFPEASYFLPPVFLPAFLASLSLSRLLYLSLKCQPRVETLNSNVSIPKMMIHVEQRKIKEHYYFVYKVDHKYRIRTNIQCYYFSVHAFFLKKKKKCVCHLW